MIEEDREGVLQAAAPFFRPLKTLKSPLAVAMTGRPPTVGYRAGLREPASGHKSRNGNRRGGGGGRGRPVGRSAAIAPVGEN